MGILDRYGQPTTSSVLNRSVEDVLYGGRDAVQPRAFVMPTDAHPIHGFFSEEARMYAAGQRYLRSGPHDLMQIEKTAFHSYAVKRPPNPDYFFVEKIPYAVGEADHNGAGMTWAWTPLGYMLYHDRIDYTACLYYRIALDGTKELNQEIWSRLLLHGVLFPDINGKTMTELTRTLVYTDPPADLLPSLMFAQPEAPAIVDQLIDAATDFQMRWNCGEWHNKDTGITKRALRRLLNVRAAASRYDDDEEPF